MTTAHPRFRLAWRLVRDAAAESARWRDHGAARTALTNAWAALRAPYGQFPGEK